ncbi:hypothetical protein [Maribellus mangrovi]|uniref:hypothetical protein n=1 Tax=Maribellus mangrovi TaxID=3133146 RepID=UPI0030EEC671
MGYNGMGYQRWIATMKPRKFLSKRSKPDGGGGEARRSQDIGEFYHIKKRDFSTLGKKKYSESDKKRILSKLINQKHIQNIGFGIGLIIVAILVALIFHYVITKLNWF